MRPDYIEGFQEVIKYRDRLIEEGTQTKTKTEEGHRGSEEDKRREKKKIEREEERYERRGWESRLKNEERREKTGGVDGFTKLLMTDLVLNVTHAPAYRLTD